MRNQQNDITNDFIFWVLTLENIQPLSKQCCLQHSYAINNRQEQHLEQEVISIPKCV